MTMDISTLSVVVKSSGIKSTTQELQGLEVQATKTEAAVDKFNSKAVSAFGNVSKAAKDLQKNLSFSANLNGLTGVTNSITQAGKALQNVRVRPATLNRDVEETLNAFQLIGKGFSELKMLLGGGLVAGMFAGGVAEVIRMADSWALMNARLVIVTGSFEAAAAAQEKVFALSNELRVPLESMTQLYSRLIPGLKEYGKTVQDAEDTTRGVAMALKLSGATGAEAASVMLQFSQSMQAGRLNGAEFNAVAEGAPLILRALQGHLSKTTVGMDGVAHTTRITRGELKKMAAEGKLTSEIVVEAIQKQLPQWSKAFGQLPVTVDDSMTLMKNSFTKAFGEINQATGFTSKLSSAFIVLANNAKLLITVVGTALVAATILLVKHTWTSVTASLAAAAAKERDALSALNLARANTQAAASAVTLATAQANSTGVLTSGLIPAKQALAAAQAAETKAATEAAAATTFLTSAKNTLARAGAALLTPQGLVIASITALGIAAYLCRDKLITLGDTTATVGQMFRGFGNTVVDMWDIVWSATKDMAGSVGEVISSAFGSILDVARSVTGDIGISWSSLFTDLLLFIPRKLDTILNVFKAWGKSLGLIAFTITDLFTTAFSTIGSAFEKIKSGDFKGAVTDVLSGTSKIKGGISEFGSEMSNVWKQVGNTGPIIDSINQIGEAVAVNVQNAKNADAVQADIAAAQKRRRDLAEAQAKKDALADAARRKAEAAREEAEKQAHKLAQAQDRLNAEQSVTREYDQYLLKSANARERALSDSTTKINEQVDAIKARTAAVNNERKGGVRTAANDMVIEIELQTKKLRQLQAEQDGTKALLAEKEKLYAISKKQADAARAYINGAGVPTDKASQDRLGAEKDKLSAAMDKMKEVDGIREVSAARQAEIDGIKATTAATWELAGATAMLSLQNSGRSLGEVLADGFGEAGAALGSLITQYQALDKTMREIEMNRSVAVAAAQGDAAKIAEANAAAADASMQAQMGAYAGMAGAAKVFFKQHTTGYKVMATAEKAFRIMEMLMAAKSFALKIGLIGTETAANTAKTTSSIAGMTLEGAATWALANVKAILGIANQAGGDPYSAFGRIAAMGAIMAGLGLATGAIGGGGGYKPPSSTDTQAAAGTGSVFGDPTAKSESIARSLSIVAENSKISNIYSAGMLASLRAIEASMTGLSNLVIRGGVSSSNFLDTGRTVTQKVDSILGKDGLGKLSIGEKITKGFGTKVLNKVLNKMFGGSKEVTDLGIVSGNQSVGSILGSGFSASKYTDIKKKGGWFSSDKMSTVTESLDGEIRNQFSMVVGNLKDGVLQAAKVLKLGGTDFAKVLDSFVVNIGRISLKGLSSEDIQKQFANIFGKVGDDMAKYALPALEKYQQVGEGYFETLMRVASNIATVDGLFLQLGIDVTDSFGLIAQHSIDAKMQLIEFAGGIEELGNKMSAYYDKFYTDAEKQTLTVESVQAKLAAMGQTVALGKTEQENLKAFRNLVESQDLSTADGRQAYAALLELAPSFASIAKTFVDRGQTGMFGALGGPSDISSAVMDSAKLWWDSYETTAAATAQDVMASGITAIANEGAKDATLQALATAMGASTTRANSVPVAVNNMSSQIATANAAKEAQTQKMLDELKASNAALKAQLAELTRVVQEGSSKTVVAIQDNGSGANLR
jgi:tape measure domain-containing protein